LKENERVHIPTAVARFAKEEPMPPREWAERGYHIVRWTEYPVGSHYAPIEVPELFAKDIIDSVPFFTPQKTQTTQS
jgi:pimeloyl-ACP methyl ester carboxylesterase